MARIKLPVKWLKECNEVAEEAWSESLDVITDHMQHADFAGFLATGPANAREQKLQEMIFDQVFKRFAELARGK